jgi:hypothetical protein
MTLPFRFSLLHSDLNDFLFASIGDEQNGVTLRVVSATRRRCLGEAARLNPFAEDVCGRGARDANCLIAEPSTATMFAGARSSSL